MIGLIVGLLLLLIVNLSFGKNSFGIKRSALMICLISVFLGTGCSADKTAILNKQLDKQISTNQKLLDKLNKAETENDTLSEKINSLDDEEKEFQSQNEKLAAKVESLEKENKILSGKNQTLTKENDSLKIAKAKIENELNYMAKESTDYQDETTDSALEDNESVSDDEVIGTDFDDSCGIKGSENGIYHVPGSTYYDRTTHVVQWFCSVEEAEEAGYRAPKR
ncbi:hypothetical protein SAMN04488137_4529 [Fictibacillus solisalsi]|uniref:Uncharacterized protein n=1 Tax=Fictibacillus solisalsi TaxID=459525 RepID=A0A1H0BKD2_9BACL|nr:hypothetical protein [Fictibacillus solisalsi]SDN46005.1 hypothetical protein SAMN04488137_4529 [Fictibacillus solisalsi]